eukprot:CAMPEP_0114426064 /NCGR_PEP_ID=MMETSP0103-20121206/7583_1 /TAXON_ID=37642 ORGANISM="Paraphysomonas imperforata, Strain PA2" /NCGR_SAMPLE_ID=MMETSP0103 /ASSEMBLY_ACC=CAM_ASM_000201 /LENGTH=702 /DNA_ID=CAMNT_0001594969 /DNA_START=42 /DNA_END=2150 /DNA_ORIENTATION=-
MSAFKDQVLKDMDVCTVRGENGHIHFQIKMSAFKDQVLKDMDVCTVRGENGHIALTAQGLGDTLLALFDRFFQGISERDLRDFLVQILKEARETNSNEQVVNTFVMAFNTRWCRGGKGAKKCFYTALKALFEEFPVAVVKVLPLIPQFGYWKDLLLLAEEIKSAPALGVDYSQLLEAIWTIYGTQLLKDYTLLQEHKASGAEGKPSLSFAGKWAPREGNHFDKQLNAVSSISKVMFGQDGSNDDAVVREEDVVVNMDGNEITMTEPQLGALAGKPRKVKYRMVISALTASLDVAEVKMAGGNYAGINISSVPSKCMTKFAKAFANEELKRMPDASEEHTGNRYPHREDRVECRQHLIDSVVNGKGVQGSQNYPHEYVEKVFSGGRMSTTMKLTVNAQWKSMRESILAMVEQRAVSLQEGSDSVVKTKGMTKFSLGNTIPLSDVSGSMSGTPMMVSIAMGILCSELTNEAFRDLVLTFTSDAKWEDLGSCGSFTDKVEKLRRAPWGGSTNFYAAMTRVADVVRKAKLKQEDIPNLLVVSDMQFNQAQGRGSGWSTAAKEIKLLFHMLGVEVHGEPLQPPTIIFWNVRGSVGYPAAADEEGVMLLSGYSPALMKFVLSGELEEEEVVEEVTDSGDVLVKKRKVQVTPTEAMKKVLYEAALDPVREALNELSSDCLRVGEGDLLTGEVMVVEVPEHRGARRNGRH